MANDDEKQWPAVDTAYDFVFPSYQLIAGRFEAADTRLTALMTLVSSVTLGVPILAKSVRPDISFTSVWFLAAVGVFVTGAVVGIVGRVSGAIELPNPMVLYENSLHRSAWEFKKNAIYFAGEAFKANTDVIRTKGNIAFFLTILWLAEVICLVVWLAWG